MTRTTPDELEMVRDVIVMTNLITMLEQQRDLMANAQELLKRLYLRSIDALIYMANRELSQIRQELRRRQIKVHDIEPSDFIHYIHFHCRGYSDRFGMTREVLKSEIQLRLTGYIKEIGAALHGHIQDRDYRPTRPDEPKDSLN